MKRKANDDSRRQEVESKLLSLSALDQKELFEKYFIKSTPEAISIAGRVLSGTDIYFRLEISTQAISARTSNGTLIPDANYADAWAAAEDGEKPTVTTTE